MTLKSTEKEKKLEEKRLKKWNETHKYIDGVDHKYCRYGEHWVIATTEYFYETKTNKIDELYTYCKECASKKSGKWNIENYQDAYDTQSKYRTTEKYKLRMKRQNKGKRELQKQWRINNKDKLREYGEKHRKHDISNKEWLNCKQYFNNSCAYCGLHIDNHYIIYKSEPKKTDFHKEHVDDKGANDLSNCVPSCRDCNSKKRIFDFDEWYNETYEHFTIKRYNKIIKWLNNDYKNYIINK